LPYEDGYFDAVITDPPYYDNESYSELSDVCYVWLRPTIGFLYPEHFAGQLTPKKKECVAAAYRQGGKQAAHTFYEQCMLGSLQQASRVTKDDGILVVVYAHKTTLGWATLVDALRRAGYTVTEAWPLDTEKKGRAAHHGDAALASSIFLVARKRNERRAGKYENEVRRDLDAIVRERVATLWELGISGADLVIACVGAGLRAFTRFETVEFANGEEVPAERFLAEVETVVLDTILLRLSKEVGGSSGKYSLAGLDAATRFYILWRYTYKAVDLDAGEAIIFANGTHVELDGAHGLSSGARVLVAKKKAKYRLLDYTERGDDEKLGLRSEGGQPPLLIDVLHRILWLMERRPALLVKFLQEAQPNRDQLRLVAQALVGPALKGGELGDVSPTGELAALARLTANWRSVVEDAAIGPAERDERRTGQTRLDFGKERRR
jgi:putative DNA methylase